MERTWNRWCFTFGLSAPRDVEVIDGTHGDSFVLPKARNSRRAKTHGCSPPTVRNAIHLDPPAMPHVCLFTCLDEMANICHSWKIQVYVGASSAGRSAGHRTAPRPGRSPDTSGANSWRLPLVWRQPRLGGTDASPVSAGDKSILKKSVYRVSDRYVDV